MTIGYLPQVMKLADTRTVRQEAETAFEDIHKLKAEVERLNNQLVERTDYESEDYHALIDRFTRESERYQMMGGGNAGGGTMGNLGQMMAMSMFMGGGSNPFEGMFDFSLDAPTDEDEDETESETKNED